MCEYRRSMVSDGGPPDPGASVLHGASVSDGGASGTGEGPRAEFAGVLVEFLFTGANLKLHPKWSIACYFFAHLSMASSFNQTRTQIVGVENQLSGLLAAYSAFASSPGPEPSPEEAQTENKISTVFSSLSALVKELNRVVDSQSLSNTISASKMQQLARHKENLNQYSIDFNRIKSTIKQERDKINLLSFVRTDIEDHERRVDSSGASGNEDGYMLNERLRLNQQHSAMDTLLGQVFETRDEILRQRNVLSSVGNRLQRSLGTMPGLNVLLSKINTRRKRDSLIIAGVIVTCIVLLWFLA
ncbi:hypothetical protein OGAPHI_003882 [Ogataea philodendri]|uniref:Golgi SNAP receptor complex member 1 n=1 Tax=Ogataea philodendri TaxID=1378263 RepID=A0A9P8P677_9ASCO|nr:uncharacterized protein OGAPHI_003882 [Ogataea philodendri]KAH3665694.1 hypothetical protein OGAPHI_003882 [Ogataea philodendri]